MTKGTTANSYGVGPSLKINEVGMDGTLKVKYIGQFEMKWRTAGASYQVGATIFDNTFIVTCIKAGTTDPVNQWGPVEAAAWNSDNTWVDGTVTWEKVTNTASDGVWRNDQTEYNVGTVLLLDGDQTGTVKVYKCVGVEGDSVALGGGTEGGDNTGNGSGTEDNPSTNPAEGAGKSNEKIIASLPKPQTLEEQYLYAWACTMAGVTYDEPFSTPYYRKEQMLKGLWQIAQNVSVTPTVIWDNTVTTAKIVDGAISSGKVADHAVTSQKIAAEAVGSEQLAEQSVSSSKVADDAITSSKIADEAITNDKVADKTLTKAKLTADVVALLLGEGTVGIVPQSGIDSIVETGDALTLDIVKEKINEIIALLGSAGIITQ